MAQSVGSEVKTLTKHSFNYGLATVFGNLIGFVMLPVYTRFLTPADYGVLELISITTSLLGLVIGIGIQTTTTRFYFDYEDVKERNLVISTVFLGYGGIILVLTALMIPFSRLFAKYILSSTNYSTLFIIAILSLALDLIAQISLTYLRVLQKSLFIMIAISIRTTVALSLNIYFVVFAKLGCEGILLSTLITNLIYSIVLTVYSLGKTGIAVRFKLLFTMIKFGLPLIPSDISMFIVNVSDRYFLKAYSSLSLTGIYSLGYRLGMLVNQMVTGPFVQIWNPRRLESFNKEDSERIHARIFTYFIGLSVFAGTMVSLLSKDVVKMMTTEPFWPAYKVVPIITLCYIISSFHFHLYVGVIMKKDTKKIGFVSAMTGILNLALNIVLIKRYNIWGAAIATLISFAFNQVLMFYYSNQYFKVQMETRRLLIIFISGFVLYFLGVQIETQSIIINIALKSMVGLCFPFVLYLMGFYGPDEIERLKVAIKTRSLKFE